MIRRETDYAIRTVLCLALAESETSGSVSTAALSEKTGVPYRFLRKIMSKLVAGEIVKSRRGKGGGVQLAKPPDDITLLDVLLLVDPDAISMNQCMRDAPPSCQRWAYCGVRQALMAVQQNQHAQLADITMGQIARLELAPHVPAEPTER